MVSQQKMLWLLGNHYYTHLCRYYICTPICKYVCICRKSPQLTHIIVPMYTIARENIDEKVMIKRIISYGSPKPVPTSLSFVPLAI